METTTMVYVGIMEKKTETTTTVYVGIIERIMEATIMGYCVLGCLQDYAGLLSCVCTYVCKHTYPVIQVVAEGSPPYTHEGFEGS